MKLSRGEICVEISFSTANGASQGNYFLPKMGQNVAVLAHGPGPTGHFPDKVNFENIQFA